MKDNSRNELKAGIVILSAVVVLLALILATGDYGQFFEHKRKMKVRLSHVGGLSVNDPVQFGGVKVGRVTKIAFKQIGKEENVKPKVEITFKVDEGLGKFLTTNTTARVTKSLTGSTVLDIMARSGEALPETQKEISGMEVPQLADVLSQLNKILLQNKDDIRKSVANTKDITENVKEITDKTQKDFQKMISNLAAASTKLRDDADRIATLVQTVNILLESNQPHINRSLGNVEKTTENLKMASQDLRRHPWKLLHVPTKGEYAESETYNAVLEFSEAAAALNRTVLALEVIEKNSKGKEQKQQIQATLDYLKGNLNDFEKVQEKLWQEMP